MKNELAGVVPHLKRLLPGFRKLRVAVIGDLMLDRYLWGAAHRLSPEAAVPVVDFASQTDCLGGAGNVAANLACAGRPGAGFWGCRRQRALRKQSCG